MNQSWSSVKFGSRKSSKHNKTSFIKTNQPSNNFKPFSQTLHKQSKITPYVLKKHISGDLCSNPPKHKMLYNCSLNNLPPCPIISVDDLSNLIDTNSTKSNHSNSDKILTHRHNQIKLSNQNKLSKTDEIEGK